MKIKVVFVTVLAVGLAGAALGQTSVVLSPAGSTWRYRDNGSDQGTAWRGPGFNDSAWASGAGQLGYGDGDEATVVSGGPSGNRYPTTYFRRTFVVPPAPSLASLTVHLMRDDGGIVYLNGVEVFRSNMPGGVVNYLSFASSTIGGGTESQFFSNTVSSAGLLVGTNVLAVEIHQVDAGSTDVSFELALTGVTGTATRPVVATQPASTSVVAEASATLTVAVSGNGPFGYQWRKDDLPLAGSARVLGVQSPALTVANAMPGDGGGYSVVISNSSGSVTSTVAMLTILPPPTTVFDDFEPTIDLSQWSGFGAIARATNFGGNVSPPNALTFGGDGDRFAVTRAIDTSAGGFISFALRLSNGGGEPWESADLPDEGVVFESSTDRGSNWTRIATYDTPELTAWTVQEFFIPPGALAPRTQFRWRQLLNSGACCDHWAIDDVSIESLPFPPIIVREPSDRVALEGGSATFTTEIAGTPALQYQWSFNGVGIPGATSPTLTLHGVSSNQAGLYRLFIDNPIGSASSREARLTVLDGTPDTFRIAALTTNHSRVVEHGALSGGDYGGLAASASRLFYSGDEATACLDLADLGNATSAAIIHDAVFSDLRSGTVYVLGTAQGPLTIEGGLATRLLSVDGQTGLLTGQSIALSDPFPVSEDFAHYGEVGFFSGYGRAAVHSGTNVYLILLPSGLVLDLGPLPALAHRYSSTWAYWGVLESFDGATWLTRAEDFRTIARTRAGDGLTQTVATFGSLGGMSAFTAVPASNRWYFHLSFASDFGVGDQLAGYADAAFSFTQTTQAVSIVQGPRGRTVVAGSRVDLQVSALGFPLRYQWLRNGTPLPGETGFRLSLPSVTTNDAGLYSVIVSNSLGAVTSAGALLRVVPAVTVAVFDDANYVATYGSPYAQSDSVQASLLSLGHQVLPFATSNLTATFAASQPVLIPALPYSNPARSFTAAQRQAVQNFVVNGGLLIVHGSQYAAGFLNDIFGLSLARQFGSGPFPRTADAAGTAFAETPASVPANSSIYSVLPQSLSLGARHAYETNDATAVASIPLGSGRVVFLAWDWSNARPLGSQDNGWLEVLAAALQENIPSPPGPPSIAVQPQSRPGVVGVDVPLNVIAYGPGPLFFQWFYNGSPIAGSRNSSHVIALPTTNSSGAYFVVVSNLSGAITSQVAQVTVRPSRGQAGYFTDYATDSTGPELSILQAAFTPVRITDMTTANLAPLRLFVLSEAAFNSVSTPLLTRLPDLTTWVQNGGRLIVHDIADGASPLLLGATRTPLQIAAAYALDVVPPGDTLVTTGPHGALTNGSLASSNFISYTAVETSALPPGAVPILAPSLAPTQTVAFAYGLGSGVVYYSTVLLGPFFDSQLAETELLRRVYLPNVLEYAHAYAAAGPAVIVQPPFDTGVLPGGRITLNVYAAGQPALRYQWSFNSSPMTGATNSSLVITGANASHVGDYRVLVSNPLGSTSSPPAHLTILDARPFRVVSLGTSGAQVIDHDALTGDDRGGIAVSRSSVFITGDFATGRFSAADLSGGTSLPVVYDALIGNLRDETVYSLANGTNLIRNSGGLVDGLFQIDGATGALTTNRLALSTPLTLSGNSVGIYSGADAAVIHDGVRAWRIDFNSGFVTDLGFMPAPAHSGCENWAYWGVAEFYDGAMWLLTVRDQQTITRTRVPDGLTSTLATFNNLSDMCSFTVSPSRDRWYYHYEGSGQFGGTSETLGYASATWDKPPTISAIGDSTVNEDAPPFTIFLNLTDDFTTVASLTTSASSSDTNLLSLTLGLVGGLRTLTVTPAPNRYGTSLVTLAVGDAIGNVTSRAFTFIVNPVNDAPSFTPGTDLTVPEDSGVQSFPAWATQINAGPNESGQVINFLVTSDNPGLFFLQPTITRTGELRFGPAANAYGSATVTVRLQDNGGTANGGADTSPPRTFVITVLPVNDPPACSSQSLTIPEDTAIPVTLSGDDQEGDPLTFAIVTPPAHGSLSGAAPDLVYRPATNYHGPDLFTFKANDGQADSLVFSVEITVFAVNDPPVAVPQSLETDEDTALPLPLTGTDVDGQSLTFRIVTPPAHGALSGAAPALTYTPATNYFGPDQFTFKASDGQADSAETTITITVRPVNDVPVADAQSLTLAEDSTKDITLTGSDLEGDRLTFSVVTPPAHGAVSGTGSNLVYTPVANYAGPDQFTFKVQDGLTDSAPATVLITVTPVNDPPTAAPLAVATDQNAPISFKLPGADLDGDKLRYTIITPPAHGTLRDKTPSFTYTPAAGFHGLDSFTYKASDGQADSAPATVTITVRQVNDAPTAVARVLNLVYLTPGSTRGVILSPNNTNGLVILDASLSSDPDGDALGFSWRRDGAVLPLAHGITTTNLFSTGRHPVILTADDGQATGTATIVVEVITAVDALDELIAFVNNSGLPAQRIRSLLSSLEAAAASFGRGQMNAGANQLGAFQNKVEAQIVRLDPALAATLNTAAQTILNTMAP